MGTETPDRISRLLFGDAGMTSSEEASELHHVVTSLPGDVVRWLRKNHLGICPSDLKA
jgi:hypothetical protein